MAKAYVPNTWINDSAPAIDSTNLNNIEDGISVANRQDLSIVVTPPTDADYTLTATENQYGRIEIDTTNWTTSRNIIMNNNEHTFLAVVNSTGSQNATFKTSAGTGIEVISGVDLGKTLRNDTINVRLYEEVIESSLLGALDINNMLHIQDQKPSGTNGGTATAGANIRVINTVLRNTIIGASLSSNQITLLEGTYFIRFNAGATYVNNHKAYLYNVSDSTDVIIGTSKNNQTGTTFATSDSNGCGVVTIVSSKIFELRHYVAVTRATDGFGVATSNGQVEVYSNIEIWKVG